MREHWIEIEDFPRYLVSSEGRIWDRVIDKAAHIHPDRAGYMRVKLWSFEEGRQTLSVHRLVADAFYEFDIKGFEINHIDGVKSNNRISNLDVCTRSENMKHAYALGLVHMPRETQVLCVETNEVFRTMREAARSIGASDHKSIMRVLDNPNRTTKGYHFELVD